VGKVILKVWVKKLFLDANIRPTKRSVKEVTKKWVAINSQPILRYG
jgi:hypothetical protein